MGPEEWLAQYDKRLTEVAARAEEADARLRRVGATAASPRGEVRVRVGAGGVLEDLTLTPSARTLESDELARLILDTTRKARHAASAQIARISEECFGEGPALEVIKQHLPAGARPTGDRDDDDYFANPPEITR
ncbi:MULTISPECIES: YbaB/EbfC family nucleoid-associated protein [Actinokineospora]|uniref:YbaB/EbfC family nucleoid-associated protein n=1 Tax=Actinokineospora TaxID=39845 RepID=UPI000D71167E|nr:MULTISPECIES: YbaB/EbfC family nucleoid-associated protein [Actinokineospora]MCG8918118.1 YbaB/EbfC family nucleoid-associated protein [Actinokineospora sp. PR83]PWW62777.1 YbaB/EbfC DNA-binding family protein [Actinokineospora spheciospongiae]